MYISLHVDKSEENSSWILLETHLKIAGLGAVTQEEHLLLGRELGFNSMSASMSGGSLLPVSTPPGNLTPTSGLWAPALTCIDPHTDTQTYT